MALLEQRFPTELAVLGSLFGVTRVAARLPRLNEIHGCTEDKWRIYSGRIPGGVVKYLLIAEAPPWSASGPPQYVLDPASRSRSLMRALKKAFMPQRSQVEPDAVLAEFAQHGFLVADSLPFSMEYSSVRSSGKYDCLVELTARSYLIGKLRASGLTFTPRTCVAFSLKRNALSVIAALQGVLDLGTIALPLRPESIAVDGAGYPDGAKLRVLYGLAKT